MVKEAMKKADAALAAAKRERRRKAKATEP
jgi:hypothetical protein